MQTMMICQPIRNGFLVVCMSIWENFRTLEYTMADMTMQHFCRCIGVISKLPLYINLGYTIVRWILLLESLMELDVESLFDEDFDVLETEVTWAWSNLPLMNISTMVLSLMLLGCGLDIHEHQFPPLLQ